MLTVTRLKLSNICQYDDIDIPISTGLMAVCGRNGSGKSTLLRGLMYGLTGLVDGSWGTQQNLQKDGCAVPGYVVVTLKDDLTHRELIVKRFSVSGVKFPDSVTEFKDGNYTEVATRRKTVDAYLGELYGISCSLLFQLVWGRQGQLDLLLTAPAAYISTFLSSVWNTKYLETLRDRLKGAIDQIAAMADPMSEITTTAKELEELKTKSKDYSKILRELENQLKDLRAQKDQISANITSASVKEARQRAILTERLNQIEGRINDVLQKLANADLDAVKDKPVSEIAEALNNAESGLAGLSDGISALQQQAADLANILGPLSQEHQQAVDKLDEAERQKERIDSFVGSERSTCAFCGGHVDDDDTYMGHIMIALGYPSGSSYATFLENIRILTKKAYDLRHEYDRISERRNAVLKSISETSFQHAELQKVRDSLAAKLITAQNLQEYGVLDAQRQGVQEELTPYTTDTKSSEYEQAMQIIKDKIQTAEQTQSQLQQASMSTAGRVEALTQIQERLEVEKEQYDVNSSARAVLSQLRDVFSQQRAQARYFASKAVELNQHLEAFLELTGMPFNLRLDPDTRIFSYTTEDGFEHPTAHLSGAQKNISAVALQMALVEVIKPNINLFLFDEPSESLDIENKIVMSELFIRLNRMLPSIGGTMLIVSRDDQLIESCENIININQKEEQQNE